jgi:hypothetical protein
MLANPSYGFGTTTKDQYLDSVLNYVLNGSSDPKAAIIPVVRYGVGFGPTMGPRYDATLFYSGNATTPAIFSDFQGRLLPGPDLTNFTSITMAAFSEACSLRFSQGAKVTVSNSDSTPSRTRHEKGWISFTTLSSTALSHIALQTKLVSLQA